MDIKINLKEIKTKAEAQIAALTAREIWTEHYTPIIGTEQVEYMLGKFQSAEVIYTSLGQGYRYFLVMADMTCAGYMATIDKPDEMFLSKLYIKKEYRKKGLARFMLDDCVRRSKEAGFKSIYLTVNKYNESTIAAYEKMGFVKIEAVKSDIGNGYYMDDYIMRLFL